MAQAQLDRGHPLSDGLVFDLNESRKGYRINKMSQSLTRAENRSAYKADQRAYMQRFGLTEEEQQWILARDWKTVNEHGGNTYFMIKLAFMAGEGLYRMGAQMRGESFDEFLATRNAGGAR